MQATPDWSQVDPVVLPDGKEEVVAFYFPGYCAPCDVLCGAPFLGNFYADEHSKVKLRPRFHLNEHEFKTAEGAFQATKFWDLARLFELSSGQEAVNTARLLSNRRPPDLSLAGYPSRLAAMEAVISSKFKEGSTLARRLCSTKDCFLPLGW